MEKNLADILVDETAFNGSDIDVAISSRASALALATHDADIKSLVGTLDQSADITLSSLARSLAVWDVSTKLAALVVGDKDNPSVDEQALLTALRKLFHVDLVDDDDVADAKMDFTAYSTIIVGYSADVAKLSALTNLAISLVFVVGEHAATIGKMATVGAGNYGTSTGTQWSLADNSHPTLLTETLGTHDIYTQSGNLGWLLSTALASGVGVFATVQGEATHVSLAILPIDGINSDGLASPEIRYFFGAQEPSKYTSHTWDHVKWIGDWLSHQITLVTLVTSLEKSKTIEEMLGKGKFQKTRDLYDYLVTGTTGSPPFEVIAEYESRSVMERLEWIKNALRKGTGTDLPANKSLYDVLALDRWDVRLDATRAAKIDNLDVTISSRASATALTTHDSDIKTQLDHATYGLAALNTDLDTLLGRLTATRAGYLDNLSGGAVALEATLTAMKGAGWTIETLKAIYDAIAALNDISAADVWTYATRTLTNPASATDLSNMRVALQSDPNYIIRDAILNDATRFAGADISAIKAYVDEVESLLKDATYGLSALKTEIDTNETKIDAVKAKTDNLPSDPADESELEARLGRKVSCMTWWSDIDDVINLTTDGVDIDLPNVVVAGIPSGATLVSAVVILKVRAIENKSSSGTNAINGAQSIRVKKSTGAWGVDDVAAIDLVDNQWSVATSTREFGDVQVGDNDVKSEVDGNATYNLRFENPIVDYATLQLNDVQVGIRIWFT